MAGYYLYSICSNVFSQLTTAPTDQQARFVAEALLDVVQESDLNEEDLAKWPTELEALGTEVKKRLASSDWYSDLTYAQAAMWDDMLHGFNDDLGERLNLDFQCASDWESIYWDCAEAATVQGATMMAERLFGGSGYRYFSKPKSEWNVYPMYTFYEPKRVRELLAQLEPIASWFEDQDDEEQEEFVEGLLEPVRKTAAASRVL